MDKRAQCSDSSDDTGQDRVLKQLKVDNLAPIEPWMPRVVKTILNLKSDDMEVSIIHENNFKDITADLFQSKYVGLTVISDKKEYPLAVCLTTVNKIHVFHYAEINLTIKFLMRVLRQKNLTFFMMDGVWTSAFLNKWKIKLQSDNVVDLQCMDMNISFTSHVLNSAAPPKKYGITYLSEHVKPLKLDLEQLVSIWMREDLDLRCTQEEIKSLRKLPYNVMAGNAIKKQASLIRSLGITMKEQFEKQMRKPSKAIFSLARRANSEIREEYDRQKSRLWADLSATLGQCPAINDEWDYLNITQG